MSSKSTKRRRPSRKQPAMRITRRRREHIERLAAALAEIAPSTSPGSGFCVRKVAEELALKDCWQKQRHKKADIAHLVGNVMRRYPRKPKTLVLKIVRGGVQWKAGKGQAVTSEQLEAIIAPMEALGFMVRREIEAIEIPEPSSVCPPPRDLVAVLDRLDLHSALHEDITEMFRDGHLNEAVRKALERFEKMVQDTFGDHKTFGRDLMAKAFGGNPPLLALNEGKTTSDRSEQEGFKFLAMGAMAALRNPLSHGDAPQMSSTDALERLAFISMLFKRVAKALPGQAGGAQ